MKKIFLKMTLVGLFFSVNGVANAGLVTQHISVNTYQRTCPGLDDPNYANNWRDAVESIYGMDPGTATTQIMCHFNGGNQAEVYNSDGSVKLEYSENSFTAGVAFTTDEVGTLEVIQATGQDQVTLGTSDGKYYANVILDETNLGLPQIKVKSESDAFERNSVNGFAATEYLWTGENETLEFTMDFDFFTSGGSWDLDGAVSFQDYIFNLSFGAAIDMTFDPDQTFPVDYGTTLAEASFSTVGESIISGTLSDPYSGSLSVTFDVQTGDQFFLWGQVQAFGLNGGFTDASHTVTSRLAVQGFTQEESLQVFTRALSEAAPSTDVPEPSTLAIFALGMIGLVSRKVKK